MAAVPRARKDALRRVTGGGGAAVARAGSGEPGWAAGAVHPRLVAEPSLLGGSST